MRRGSQLLILAIVFLSLAILVFSNTSALAQTYPETIRIGLYYGSSGVSSVSFNSKAGLEAGYYANGQFATLISEAGGKQLIARKDTYFIKGPDGALTQYNPAEGLPYNGETFGPYHIQIGDKVSDFAAAQNFANMFKQAGIPAYPVYDGGWAIWTGFYSDADKANADLPNLQAITGINVFNVVPPSSTRIILYNGSFEPLLIFASSDPRLVIRPSSANNPSILSVNGKQYRGEIELRRFADSDMTVINIINIEHYLYGVVPREIEASSPMEALKAQAVAARTFAYANMGKYKKWDFDLDSTVNSQVYGGFDSERATSNQAVDDTKGKKALYNGRPASMHYFSSSGGMTEDSVNVWGAAYPYLTSVPDPYEAGNSRYYTWSKTFTAEDIKMKLFLSGVEIGDILTMKAIEHTPAGRVNKLQIVGTKGSITYNREDIRIILGDSSEYLPSRMFTINTGASGDSGTGDGTAAVVSANGTSAVNVYGVKAISSLGISDTANTGTIKILGAESTSIITGTIPSGTFVLTGKGWGHAVGMSQEGAKGFAQNGYTYDKILMHYFKGIVIE